MRKLSIIDRLFDNPEFSLNIRLEMDAHLFSASLFNGSDYCISYMRANEFFRESMVLTKKRFLRRGYTELPSSRRRLLTLPVTLDNYQKILQILDNRVVNGERIELKLADEEGKPVDLVYEHKQFKIPKLAERVKNPWLQAS